jgi:hypothetical protein
LRKNYTKLIKKIPFFSPVFQGAITIEVIRESTQALAVAANPAISSKLKFWSIAKAGTCTTSLVTAYASRYITEPRIASAFFYICCGTITVYYKCGGKTLTAIGLLSLARKNSLPPQN